MQAQPKPIAEILSEEKRPPRKVRAKIYGRRYLVTDDGKIYTMGINGGQNVHLKITRSNGKGYLRANIGRHDEYVHRIVATCFVPNPHGYLRIFSASILQKRRISSA